MAIQSRATRYRRLAAASFLILGISLLCCATSSLAQSVIAGDVTGTITDPTGAVVPGASLTLTNTATNTSKQVTTTADGTYRFAFVEPGTYKLAIAAKGFRNQEHDGVVVTAGQPTAVNAQLALASGAQTVDVVESVSTIQTENADISTNVDSRMIQDLPNPGGDMTYFVQTMPGIVMNTQSGYGNFSAQGMPGISNLFTVNGMNFNDPFLSINNSGSSNLMLGSNDIAEANVINNAYSAQYGQYAGSQVTYISKSGTNQFHGDLLYNWNGRALNANQFFSNAAGLPTSFNNFNQWGVNVNGPIIKNKTFFDVDYEGVRNLFSTAAVLNNIPSPAFQAATLTNLAAIGDASEIPFYKQAFAVYNGAPAASAAIPVANSCPDLSAYPGSAASAALLPANGICADQFRSTPTTLNREYLWNARVDHTFNDHDRGFIRVGRDAGFQPTYTSPFGPTFNLQSNQPQMTGQVSEIHTFNPTTVNQLNGAVFFYSAIFVPSDPSGALAALPTFLSFTDGAFQSVGAYAAPGNLVTVNGRRVFQYQVSDDLSKVWGRHTFRIGYSWLHQNVTDFDFGSLGGLTHGQLYTNLGDFYMGGGGAQSSSFMIQGFPTSLEEGFRFNTNGGYVADDWKATERLTVSLNLRFESYADPTCDSNCFARFAQPFNGSAVPNALTTPYNQMILSGEHTAYANVQTAIVEPRIGIAFRPFNSDKTVIRTGAGIFADELPNGVVENAAFNPPGLLTFIVGAPTLAPGAPGNPFTAASTSNAAFQAGYPQGASFNSLSASAPAFAPPSFYGFPTLFKTPHYYKWNFQIEQALGWKTLLTVNYAGMHGVQLPIADFGLNAYYPSGFAGLPTAPANPAIGTVYQYLSGGTASYNGLIVSLQRRLADGLTFTVNYTWSHALDDVSNGGIANAYYSALATNLSITEVQNPYNFRGNYGNADYDVRNYFSANMVLTDAFRHAGFKWGPKAIFGGWTLSSNWFARSGLPWTAVNGALGGALGPYNYQGVVFAQQTAPVINTNCGANAVNAPCVSSAAYVPAAAQAGFGNSGRNNLRGPSFFDVDLALLKAVQIKERLTFQFGVQAYNLFNHANFDNPVDDVSNPLGQFGTVVATVETPTSILGSFFGAGASPRFVEVKAKLTF